MNRLLYFIVSLTVSCPIISGENSDDSYSPKDDSSRQNIVEYNSYPKNKRSKKRNGSPLFKKKTIQKKEISYNNTEVSFNNNFSLFNDISYLFSSDNNNNMPSQNTYHYFYQDVIGARWNNNMPSQDTYYSFYPDTISFPWNAHNDNYLNEKNKKILLKENVINHTRDIKPSKKWEKKDLKEKNKRDKKIIIKNNAHIKKEDLKKCFEILEKANPHIPIAQAIYESQKHYNEKK